MSRSLELEHVGKNIRIYRKSRAMTIDDLAEKIHKSRSSVSKYESGQVAIDILTLLDIAKTLHVAPIQLLDIMPESAKIHYAIPQVNPFGDTNTLYMYNLYDDEVLFSVIKLVYNHLETKTNATLFYKIEDPQNQSRCHCIYHGDVFFSGPVLTFIVHNIHNDMEHVLMEFVLPMKNFSEVAGMIAGLEFYTYEPVAQKAILSNCKIPVDEAFRKRLTVSAETIKTLKARNKLFIHRT